MTTAHLKIAVIGGTGLGNAFASENGSLHNPDTPFGKPSAPILQVDWAGNQVFLLKRHGEGHVYNPSMVPYLANIFALKTLGVTHIVASGACGSLREHIAPGDLVIADQIIDKTYKRSKTFFTDAAVHTELSEPFCPVMRQWLLAAAPKLQATEPGTKVHDKGTYVCMEGPTFSTRAESHMHRAWGADLVGMTAMPEARLAREAQIAYALVNLPTDYDAWRPHDASVPQHELLKEIIANIHNCTRKSIALIKCALSDTSLLRSTPSHAHSSLANAIWTDKKLISPAEIERLRPLWGHHF
jgi:5'-methylthioadenosine phosphorylase